MFPYLVLLGAPTAAAMMTVRRVGVLFFMIAILFWLMIGLRFDVGPDWDNYLRIYNIEKDQGFLQLETNMETGFGILMWFASVTGGGIILVNLVSAAVFCWGIFTFAKKCYEPFLAVAIATPYLAIVVAMSATRQAISIGLVAFLFATWNDRTLFARILLIFVASLFHLSAIFVLIFVALGARISTTARVVAASLLGLLTLPLIVITSSRADIYAARYIGAGAITSEGAFIHVAMVAVPATAYLLMRNRWRAEFGPSAFLDVLAITPIVLLFATYFSPVAADRMSLYFWPVVMFLGSGWPALIQSQAGRIGFRLVVFFACFSLLIGWFYFANHSKSYLPYQNYVSKGETAPVSTRR